jgi:large-conductance mechanosensitive channel
VDYNIILEKKDKGGTAMAFLGSFLQYLIEMILLAAIGVLGVFTGKKLRDRKDAKLAETTASEKQQ